jgi:hypothetical protein
VSNGSAVEDIQHRTRFTPSDTGQTAHDLWRWRHI